MSGEELLVVALVSLAGSFVKSVTGMGYPLIAIPVLALFLGVETAVVVIAIPNALLNGLLCVGVRHALPETRDLPVLAATALVGGTLGTFVLVEAPERPLLWALAAMVAVFVVQRRIQPAFRWSRTTAQRAAPVVGLAAGFCHGAVGASGPVVAWWFHGYRLGKDAYVLCITLLFLAGGLAQLGVLLATAAFDRDRSIATVVALAATLVAMPFGTRLRSRLAGESFERLIVGLLVVSGALLIGRALR